MQSYGGGLFAPVTWKEFRQLYRQFNPNKIGTGGPHWLHSRHSVHTRKEVKRERAKSE